MILVDKTIKARHKEIFPDDCYHEEHVNSVSYELHIRGVVVNDKLISPYALDSGKTIFIKTVEKIHMPKDLVGRIGEKNSRMRQGLCVAGPHYFPGHETYLYLRVQNLSETPIILDENDAIAQIFFEKLDEIPEKTYDQQGNASYNNEDEYRGMAKYKKQYEK